MESTRQTVSLPDSCWHKVLSMLDFRSKLNCARVNKQLHGLLSKPGLWSTIDVTLEQLLAENNDEWQKDFKTPAARWILARITRELEDPDNWPSNRTDLHISGHASCIAEGLTVPWFFSKLDADNIDYGLFLELSGHPGGLPDIEYDPELPFGAWQPRIQLNLQTARDIGNLWSSHLSNLTLKTPPTPFSGDHVLLVRALTDLRSLTLHGADFALFGETRPPGLQDNLAFLEGKTDLQTLGLVNHCELTCITHLKHLTSLTELTLIWTGLTQWPDVMSSLTSLRCLKIERAPQGYKEFSQCDYDLESRVFLQLSGALFHYQPDLFHLSLSYHVLMLDQVESFQSLKNLRILDLTGCDIMGLRPGNGEIQMMSQFSVKPLQGLIHLEELYLGQFAPYTGGWSGMRNGLCDLGVTCMSFLEDLDLSCNHMESVPRHLSALSALTFLDLSNNLLQADCVLDPAILCLSRLQALYVNNCIGSCLVSAIRASSSYHHHFGAIGAFGAAGAELLDLQARNRAANAVAHAKDIAKRLHEPPDLSKLRQACPHLRELHICNAA